MEPVQRVTLTARGLGLAVVGVVGLLTGALLGVVVLVQVGALLLLGVGAGVGWLTMEARAQSRGRLRLSRQVIPHPVTVGGRAVVRVEVTAAHGGRSLERLDIAERAARELSGSTPLRARVQRSPQALTLSYPVFPERRGRWPVGPLEVQRRDFFGMAHWRGPLGEAMLVAVRPFVVALQITNRAASTDVDRAAVGARTPAADDSSLRDYRIGDDLRRVHWRSSARRGELVVRQDERSGRRPSSVLLDIPLDDATAEWSISLAASIALALVAAGHHVRILGGDVLDEAADHHRPDAEGASVDALLDHTVDLTLPANRGTRLAWLLAAVDTLAIQPSGPELVFAVLGAQEVEALTAMARTGAANTGWAMVRVGTVDEPAGTRDEQHTLAVLRRAGWTACAVHPGEDIAGCWDRLLGSNVHAGAVR